MTTQLDPLIHAVKNGREPGWFVEVVWPWGTRTQVRHFATEQEALDWIARDSRNWLHASRTREPESEAD